MTDEQENELHKVAADSMRHLENLLRAANACMSDGDWYSRPVQNAVKHWNDNRDEDRSEISRSDPDHGPKSSC